MTIEKFNQLTEEEKAETALKADIVAEMIKAGCHFNLYLLADFYIEVAHRLISGERMKIKTYKLNTLPAQFATLLVGLPIVTYESYKDAVTIPKALHGK